jgi:hypothetical protein
MRLAAPEAGTNLTMSNSAALWALDSSSRSGWAYQTQKRETLLETFQLLLNGINLLALCSYFLGKGSVHGLVFWDKLM